MFTQINLKRVSLLALALLMTCGCSKRVEYKIAERINDDCKPAVDCTIKIRDVTDFGWDEMFVFKYSAGRDQIERALGTSFPDYVEFKRRMVFTKNGAVVYREDEPTNIEHPVDGEVIFDIPDSEVYRSYRPDTAVFRVRKKEYRGSDYYLVTQVK